VVRKIPPHDSGQRAGRQIFDTRLKFRLTHVTRIFEFSTFFKITPAGVNADRAAQDAH
jgi:hypothetical protein